MLTVVWHVHIQLTGVNDFNKTESHARRMKSCASNEYIT